jgi:biopolymer transport protein ExbB
MLVLALAFEQAYTFWGLVERARELGAEVGKLLVHGDLQAARTVCERSSSPVADIFIAALNTVQRPGQSEKRAAERERQRFALWMKRRLWAIGTVGSLAPFIGLFGTVVGIIRAFRDIGLSGTGGFSVVAAGVAEALYATAGGIFVAVVAVMFYNYFQSRGNRATVEVKLVVDEFLELLDASKGSWPEPSAAAPASVRAAVES